MLRYNMALPLGDARHARIRAMLFLRPPAQLAEAEQPGAQAGAEVNPRVPVAVQALFFAARSVLRAGRARAVRMQRQQARRHGEDREAAQVQRVAEREKWYAVTGKRGKGMCPAGAPAARRVRARRARG